MRVDLEHYCFRFGLRLCCCAYLPLPPRSGFVLSVFSGQRLNRIGLKGRQNKVFSPDGTPADFQLQFDYGSALQAGDDGVSSQIQNYDHSLEFFENLPFGVTYDSASEQYIVLHAKSFLLEGTEEERSAYEFEMGGRPVSVSAFDQTGAHIRAISINSLYYYARSKVYINPAVCLFIRNENRVFYQAATGNAVVIDLQTGTFEELLADTIHSVLSEEPALCKNSGRSNAPAYFPLYDFLPPECPVIVEYDSEGTKIYSRGMERTLFQTLDKGYELAFYSFNSDGSCNLLFQHG